MEHEDAATSAPPRQIVGGVKGWVLRKLWKRRAKKIGEPDIDELRKRLIIMNRQLGEMPISSRIQKRRMELLRERERCEVIIAEWEKQQNG